MDAKNPAMRRILNAVAILAAPFLLILLVRSSTGLANRILEKRYPPPGQMVSMGNYKLQLYCSGSGSPTIIIEPGTGSDWVMWRNVITPLASTNRVCVYDRAGYGWSERGPKPRTALQETGELHRLLSRAGVAPPYVLLAHSFGGYIARIYASKFRDSLAGVVLVDPSHEDEAALSKQAPAARPAGGWRMRDALKLLPPLGIERVKRMYNGDKAIPEDLRHAPRIYQERYLIASSLVQLEFERNEHDSLSLTWAQAREAVFPRDLALTVITALHSGRPDRNPVELPAAHSELQGRLAHSSRFGRQIFARRSGHMVPFDEPELVVSAVQDMIRQPQQPEVASR
jgi:pimeloyl-ACP methyl ester carboxylesterase